MLDIKNGDNIFVSSDIKSLVWQAKEHDDEVDLNLFIDSIIEKIGLNGTLMFPTYNWEFCEGKAFDYYKTKCKTGTLGSIALKRNDFVRTKHPIYSFAVWGHEKEALYQLNNISSFGEDSPFAFMKKCGFKNLIIDVTYQHCLTYVHYVEERIGNTPYRYLKEFQADYTDENNVTTRRQYSMYVRDLDKEVKVTIDPLDNDFIKDGAVKKYMINGIEFKLLDIVKADRLIENDILNNKSRKLCTYKGQ